MDYGDKFTANEALASHMKDFAGDEDLDELLKTGRSDGSLIKMKARMFYEEVVFPALMDAMVDPLAGHQTKMDVAKHVAEIADLKPKPNQIAATGTNLHVSINIPDNFVPQAVPGKARQVLDIVAEVVDPLSVPEPEPPPEPPKPFSVPDFKLATPLGPPAPLPTARS